MEQFASGWKQHYYGKGDVIVYRLNRRPASGTSKAVFGANVLMLIYGEVFWPTYTTGDNAGLIATDSMKNFIQRQTTNFASDGLEEYCDFLAATFLATYPQVEGVQVSAVEIPYSEMDGRTAFVPGGPDRASARVELGRSGPIELLSGLRGFKLLRLSGSGFVGFVHDEFTTLPDQVDRPLYMWLDLEWRHTSAADAFTNGAVTAQVRRIVRDVFQGFASGSIQQVIYQMGTRLLADIPSLAEVHLEANNRTWDTIAERGDEIGVYTDPRPPYGCLGLRLKRQ